MSLDHGILNMSLAKRGNIDTQLDKYKADKQAEQRRAQQARALSNRTAKAAAKVALAELIAAADLLDQKASKLKITRRELVALLTDWSKWEPAKVINARNQWLLVEAA